MYSVFIRQIMYGLQNWQEFTDQFTFCDLKSKRVQFTMTGNSISLKF